MLPDGRLFLLVFILTAEQLLQIALDRVVERLAVERFWGVRSAPLGSRRRVAAAQFQ